MKAASKIITLFFMSIMLACNSKTGSNTENSNITSYASDDEVMNEAIRKAKETFKDFDTAYKNGHFDKDGFSVKVKFEIESGAEHIWANNITFENENYYGIIDEDAVGTKKIKQGDKVKITIDKVSDWVYGQNDTLKGGYTIRVHRNTLSPEEKASFDSNFNYKIVE